MTSPTTIDTMLDGLAARGAKRTLTLVEAGVTPAPATQAGWTVRVTSEAPAGRWGMFTVAAARAGVMMRREHLDAGQVASFDCAAEWDAGLARRRK